MPAAGCELSFSLPLGPKPALGWKAETVIGLAGTGAESVAPAVSVNGTACELRHSQTTEKDERLLTYTIPLGALPGGNTDIIAVRAEGGKTVKVLRVEVRLTP